MSYRLGADVGASFTDLVLVNDQTGQLIQSKLDIHSPDKAPELIRGIEQLLKSAAVDPAEVSLLAHGTPLVDDLLLKRHGALVGLVTTRGHRHVLHLGHSAVPGGLGGWMHFNQQRPLAPLSCTVEARERIGSRGDVVEQLDEAHLLEQLHHLAAQGVQVLAVSLLNSFVNPDHERQISALAADILPGVPVVLSSDLQPLAHEYERSLCTVASAYCLPALNEYLDGLQQLMSRSLPGAQLRLLRSDGGVAPPEAVRNNPLSLIRGGAAAGAWGANRVGLRNGCEDLLTLDIGGNSSELGLIREGAPSQQGQSTIDGLSLRGPAMELRSLPQGGATVARVPAFSEELQLGPSRTDNGHPSLTDAHLLLGHLLPATGQDGEVAARSLETVASSLEVLPQRVAEGMVDVFNESLYGTFRLMAVEHGADTRDFALVAYGGAGPLHANTLALQLQSWPVLIPPGPAVLNAYGAMSAPLREQASCSITGCLGELADGELLQELDRLHARAARTLEFAGVQPESASAQLQLRYQGQSLTFTVDIDRQTLQSEGTRGLAESFHRRHKELFGFSTGLEPELVSLTLQLNGPSVDLPAAELELGDADPETARSGETSLWIERKQTRASVYDRQRLLAGMRIHGPAIITEPGSTTLVLPGHAGEVAPCGDILIRPTE